MSMTSKPLATQGRAAAQAAPKNRVHPIRDVEAAKPWPAGFDLGDEAPGSHATRLHDASLHGAARQHVIDTLPTGESTPAPF